jgi:A/G-specific adenine glycosylase
MPLPEDLPQLTSQQIEQIRSALLTHYKHHRRDLPWRKKRTPYEIWVSEIMLQQTQVETVIPRYDIFLQRFPNLKSLAQAQETEVCEAWAGLGYYRRALYFHRGARYIIKHFDGEIPQNAAELEKVPGIGAYTAGAIASIAFHKRAAAVDGNVLRICARLLAYPEPGDSLKLKKTAWQTAQRLVQGPHPGDFNQALMDLGATICTPKNPQCMACPIQKQCMAHDTGEAQNYPRAKTKRVKKKMQLVFACVETPRGLWLKQRSLDGLWPGLWEPPSAEGPEAKTQLEARLGTPLGSASLQIKHELTHRKIEAEIYRIFLKRETLASQDYKPFDKPLEAPLSALARKVIVTATQL